MFEDEIIYQCNNGRRGQKHHREFNYSNKALCYLKKEGDCTNNNGLVFSCLCFKKKHKCFECMETDEEVIKTGKIVPVKFIDVAGKKMDFVKILYLQVTAPAKVVPRKLIEHSVNILFLCLFKFFYFWETFLDRAKLRIFVLPFLILILGKSHKTD
jgi:hypothetical protein